MIILFEYVYPNSNSSSACDLRRLQITAKTLGLNTIILSPYFSETGDTTSLELDLLRFSGNINETAIFIGYIPDAVNYAALERALSSANIKLINTTEEHLRVMEFDQFYPLIEKLTPKSAIVNNSSGARFAANSIGYPVFVKGLIKSLKERGLTSCIANNDDELNSIVAELLIDNRTRNRVTRNRVVVRELVDLVKYGKCCHLNDLPVTREFRIHLYNGEILGSSFHWPFAKDTLNGYDLKEVDLALDPMRDQKALEIAREAAKLIATPLMVVDVGQKTDGEWIVIEVGDLQCCGLSNMSHYLFFNHLEQIMLNKK